MSTSLVDVYAGLVLIIQRVRSFTLCITGLRIILNEASAALQNDGSLNAILSHSFPRYASLFLSSHLEEVGEAARALPVIRRSLNDATESARKTFSAVIMGKLIFSLGYTHRSLTFVENR